MKVKLVDIVSPRSDRIPGFPTGITNGKVYTVAEIHKDKYSIINDDYKIARYSQKRFEVVDDTPVEDLRTAFNMLTHEMRMELKELKKQVQQVMWDDSQ